MEKRWITGLLIAISVALVGLMAIQVKWMRDTVDLREVQFHRSVDNALFAVCDRLEQLERMQVLKEHAAGRKLLGKLDALRSMRAAQEPEIAPEAEEGSTQAEVDTNDLIDTPEPPSPPRPLEPFDPSDTLALLGAGWQALDEEQEALVSDLVRGIMASELSRDIHDRIDPGVLDSLLRDEFKANGIPGPMHYAVLKEGGTSVLVGRGDLSDTSATDHVGFREKLFRHDLAGPSYFLEVQVAGQKRFLLHGMWPMLLTSAVFMCIIGVAFLFTIRTIFRQKRISEIRNDLVNNLTHELKTPISTIGLACEALTDPSMPKTDEQVRNFVNMIRDENKRLGSLVENVLQSAVLESGHMLLKRVDLDLHALVHDVVRSSGIQLTRRNGRIDLELNAEIHRVNGDRIHLTNLLYNLVDNAIKYAEQEPRIRIATTSNDEGVTVSVTDNGIGIATSEQRKVFDRLYRVPTGNIHNAKGFGLGLSYVRTVVERHGGRIKLESVPGKGSTFHIFIPFEHVRTAEVAARRG